MYVGRSALEIKLREAPTPRAYGASEAVPVAMVSAPTERLMRPLAGTPPVEREEIPTGIMVARTTLVGLSLTAFACGIVVTVALDAHHLRALEHEVRAQAEVIAAAAQQPAPPAAPVVAEAAPRPIAAPSAPEPVVVQMPAETPAPAAPVVRQPPAPARVAAARTPRPPAPRGTVRRRTAPTASPDPAEPADNSSAAGWVDPFAQ